MSESGSHRPRHRTRWRPAAPEPGLGLAPARALAADLPTIALVLGTLLGMAALSLDAVPLWHRVLMFAVAQTAIDAFTGWLATRLARGAAPGADRRFWRGIAVAVPVGVLGDMVQNVDIASSRDPGYSFQHGHSSWFVILAVAVALVAMAIHPIGPTEQRHLTRFWLDAGVVATGIAASAWSLVVAPTALDGDATELSETISSAILITMIGFLVVKVVLSSQPPMTRTAGSLVTAAYSLLLLPVAGVFEPPDPDRLPATIVVRLLSDALILAAFRSELVLRRTPRAGQRVRRRPYSHLPYVTMLGMYVVLLATRPADLDVRAASALVGAIVVSILVVVRQLVAFADNAELVTRLDASLSELARHEQRLRSLLQHSSDITLTVDASGCVSYVSPPVERILGIPPEQFVGRHWLVGIHADDMATVTAASERVRAARNSSVTVQARMRHRDGDWRWLEFICTNLLHDPTVNGIVGNIREVTETRLLHDQLRHQASHDSLTGLANRVLFGERLAEAASAGDAVEVGVLLIDLDGFKGINDALGHHVGDLVLVAVAERLVDCVRDVDTAARLGGDEFAVVLPGADAAQAAVVAERFTDRLAEPVPADGHRLRVRASIGIAAGAGGAADGDDLLRAADAAMYRAKTAHRAARPAGTRDA